MSVHADTCSGQANGLNAKTSAYACDCGATTYAICSCCSAIMLPDNTPRHFTSGTYTLTCALCHSVFCVHCANLSFERRLATTAGMLCHPCTSEYIRQEMDADVDAEVEEQRRLFVGWNITLGLTYFDRDRRVQNRSVTVPLLARTFDDARSVALDYTGVITQHSLDPPTRAALLDACREQLTNNCNQAPPLLAVRAYHVHNVASIDQTNVLRLIVVFNPVRKQLIE